MEGMGKIYRNMYLSWLAKKEDMTGEIQGLSQRRLRKAVAEGMILSSAIFKDEDRFLLYIESRLPFFQNWLHLWRKADGWTEKENLCL